MSYFFSIARERDHFARERDLFAFPHDNIAFSHEMIAFPREMIAFPRKTNNSVINTVYAYVGLFCIQQVLRIPLGYTLIRCIHVAHYILCMGYS